MAALSMVASMTRLVLLPLLLSLTTLSGCLQTQSSMQTEPHSLPVLAPWLVALNESNPCRPANECGHVPVLPFLVPEGNPRGEWGLRVVGPTRLCGNQAVLRFRWTRLAPKLSQDSSRTIELNQTGTPWLYGRMDELFLMNATQSGGTAELTLDSGFDQHSNGCTWVAPHWLLNVGFDQLWRAQVENYSFYRNETSPHYDHEYMLST